MAMLGTKDGRDQPSSDIRRLTRTARTDLPLLVCGSGSAGVR